MSPLSVWQEPGLGWHKMNTKPLPLKKKQQFNAMYVVNIQIITYGSNLGPGLTLRGNNW